MQEWRYSSMHSEPQHERKVVCFMSLLLYSQAKSYWYPLNRRLV
jgi:hypothetical protein